MHSAPCSLALQGALSLGLALGGLGSCGRFSLGRLVHSFVLAPALMLGALSRGGRAG